AVVFTLKKTVVPLLTLISDPKPWIDASPAPLMSHSLDGFPVRQFSATVAFGGDAQTPEGPAVVNDDATFTAKALPATSLIRGSLAPPTSVAVYVVPATSGALGTNVAVIAAALLPSVPA